MQTQIVEKIVEHLTYPMTVAANEYSGLVTTSNAQFASLLCCKAQTETKCAVICTAKNNSIFQACQLLDMTCTFVEVDDGWNELKNAIQYCDTAETLIVCVSLDDLSCATSIKAMRHVLVEECKMPFLVYADASQYGVLLPLMPNVFNILCNVNCFSTSGHGFIGTTKKCDIIISTDANAIKVVGDMVQTACPESLQELTTQLDNLAISTSNTSPLQAAMRECSDISISIMQAMRAVTTVSRNMLAVRMVKPVFQARQLAQKYNLVEEPNSSYFVWHITSHVTKELADEFVKDALPIYEIGCISPTLRIHRVSNDNKEDVALLVAQVFTCKEAFSTNSPIEAWVMLVTEFLKYCIHESFVLYDTEKQQYCSFSIGINHATATPSVEKLLETEPILFSEGIIFALLSELEADFLAQLPSTARTYHALFGGTKVEYEGTGIGSKMRKLTIEFAAELGFDYLMVDATSPATQHIWRKLGLQEGNSINVKSTPIKTVQVAEYFAKWNGTATVSLFSKKF